ncbi:alpha/beta fold hydrolase [Streptomyces sp. XM4193]|uniref:esterase/lipase family protein n=1 Tax=Streptomyces sp. XM4193 TaxID=2929782 RepID=UPI001FF82E4B|nr:alpha/beta fold hydrolase [Streptomyces sp. XM4193]MCK1795521.1 alpha/beta fold hydrolase [Streptomyces sp. XM4193]
MPRSPSDLLSVLGTTVLEATALAGHLVLYPSGMAADAPVETRADRFPGRRPVVLVHGFIDNRSVFALMRRSLRRHDWPVVTGFNYSPFAGDVPATARQLADLIEDVCTRTGHHEVDLVCHSLGGLVARYCVQRLGGDSRVHTVVTLGTPHLGTSAAPLLSLHPIVRQIRPDSRVMAELAEPVPECRTRFISFHSDLDPVMSPPQTARLDRADLRVREVPVRGIGHLAMPAHWAVIARVREELVTADTAPGGEAEDLDAPAASSGDVPAKLPAVQRAARGRAAGGAA